MREQSLDLLAGEHGGKGVVIFGADLGKDRPVRLPEQINKAHFGGGEGLSNGFGLPLLLEFDEEEVVAQLGLGEGGGITGEMLVQEPELAIIGMAGPIGVIMQSQQISEPGHGLIRVVIIDGISVVPGRGSNLCGCGRSGSPLALWSAKGSLMTAALRMVDVAGE